MAIDANVLINERIREELRNGNTPQAAINAGYERAWGTILDSNITTLIAGVALFMFGSGPVRGFAVVHCLGILTSMFSAVVVSRAHRQPDLRRPRKLEKLAIGNTDWHKRAARRDHAGADRRTLTRQEPHDHGILPHPQDIPFMRHALVFNVISLITFLLAVVFARHQGPAPRRRVHRRHGDGGVLCRRPPTSTRCAARSTGSA